MSLHSTSWVFIVLGILFLLTGIVIYAFQPYVRYTADSKISYKTKNIPVEFEWIASRDGIMRFSKIIITEDWVLDVENPITCKNVSNTGKIVAFHNKKNSGIVQIPRDCMELECFYLSYKGQRVLYCKKR